MVGPSNSSPEIIAVTSGKGGTGKTLITACLGYALIKSKHRVLLIDADPATDGLSHLLLGPQGIRQRETFKEQNTFTGILREFQHTERLVYEPYRINRSQAQDHGAFYWTLISGKGLYGDQPDVAEELAVPDLDRKSFNRIIAMLFDNLRKSGTYDYILVDTRGGFSFESTSIDALADSFILVTEPQNTSFYQDRNLILRISETARDLGVKPLMRAIIVNKASESEPQVGNLDLTKIESSFRHDLVREFSIPFEETHPVPLDLQAMKAYKTQAIPYQVAADSNFAFATLSAFGDILKVVTARWTEDEIKNWNKLVDKVSAAIERRNQEAVEKRKQEKEAASRLEKLQRENERLRDKLEGLERELRRAEETYKRELERSEALFSRKEPETLITKRLFLLVFPVLVLIIATFYLNQYFTFRAEERRGEILESVYREDVPLSLRIEYLRRLLGLDHRNFDGINLIRADLSGLDLSNVSLRNANLAQSVLVDADLRNADLRGALLQMADFRSANLEGATLSGAVVQGTDFRFAIGLSGDQLRSAQDWSFAFYSDSVARSLGLSPDHNESIEKMLQLYVDSPPTAQQEFLKQEQRQVIPR